MINSWSSIDKLYDKSEHPMIVGLAFGHFQFTKFGMIYHRLLFLSVGHLETVLFPFFKKGKKLSLNGQHAEIETEFTHGTKNIMHYQ